MIYLISGDDDFEKKAYVEKIKGKFSNILKGINFIQIDQENIHTLESEITTYSFFNEPKLIIVKVPTKTKDEETAQKVNWLTDELIEELKNIDKSITLIFIEEGNNKSKLQKIVSQIGKQIIFEKKKASELSKWVLDICTEQGTKITNADIAYLLDLCGNNKNFLWNELKKLIDYTYEEKIITREAIDKMCIKTSDVIIFDLTDSLGNKNPQKALKCLEDLIENKEPIQKIEIMLAKHFKSLLLTKLALREKRDVAKELNISYYPAKKYSEQSKNFTLEEIKKIFKEFAKLDIDSKTGKMDLEIGIQKIILGT